MRERLVESLAMRMRDEGSTRAFGSDDLGVGGSILVIVGGSNISR